MRVLLISKALVVGTAQRKLELMAQEPGIELTAVAPPCWREPRVGPVMLEESHTTGYRLLVQPLALNGNFHLHFWPGLGRLLRQERPEVLHIDEESFNLATFQAIAAAGRLGIPALFFNWANILRRLPPPFAWLERYNLRHAAYAVAGNQDAATILRHKGYHGPLRVIPQFGVDAEAFSPVPRPPAAPANGEYSRGDGGTGSGLTIGYAGRLVPQKGLMDLLEAAAGLPPTTRLLLVGQGDLLPQLRQRAAAADLHGRVEFAGWLPSADMPAAYRRMDVLVLPSRTTPNWKEQFGRVLIDAMASGVPVVGSDSGEIPHVIGPAGLVFPEGDVAALRERLARLLGDAALRAELGRRGRERVLAHYTQEKVARSYVEVYREMQGKS